MKKQNVGLHLNIKHAMKGGHHRVVLLLTLYLIPYVTIGQLVSPPKISIQSIKQFMRKIFIGYSRILS